uniref:Plant heme peroxidase family profile domain-containing protein n=1 Tax=Aegilops tauschii subsp. strangulata TaxID=200361 RepID=A0A452XX22_AEGTS
ELKVGYYDKSCRGVENVVKWHVARAIKANRKSGAALVRLIFHDCFVRVRTPPAVVSLSVTPAGAPLLCSLTTRPATAVELAKVPLQRPPEQ